ncbi:MAG TPA: DUF177 domain-containing protein [Caldimonas sp.]|nr:DUF177 domain-containing protein [Caldimonas sp.]
MTTKSGRFDPRHLDMRAFAAAHGEIAGDWPLAALARLAGTAIEGSVASAAPVTWNAAAGRSVLAGAGSQAALSLRADANLAMQCQRCLQPVDVPLAVARRIFFVEGEDAAAALDEDSDDDVLALEPAIDLRTLVEDELLLALPLIARHEECPQPLVAPLDDLPQASGERPFAALAALKARRGDA